ncbi:MAG: dihydropteroate synthase [Anaerolineae bacterium]|jgi:5-methyltetrahydrofolate--homocysteine methyltransferase|nr:dihydropteroate synthase [Anaerolineae bacterium]
MQTVLKGPSSEVIIAPDQPIVIIGERINPTGRKAFSAELREGDLSRVARDAVAQINAGAAVLDVNVGAAGVDEVALLPQAVQIVQDTVDVPVCLDSANPDAIAAGLKVVKGRALINSVNGETDKLKAVLPLVAEYGAAVIALCMDDTGIPSTPGQRLEVAQNILDAARSYGIPPEDILLDPLVMAVGADHKAAQVTVETARMLRASTGCNLTAGASNVSHGMPERDTLNTVFLALLAQAGINAPICNPLKNGLSIRAIDLLSGRDEWGARYIKLYRATKTDE